MLRADCIGRRAYAALKQCPRGRVITSSTGASNLATDTGSLVAIVAPDIGPGPFNIVAAGLPIIAQAEPFLVSHGVLEIGPARVALDGAEVWAGIHGIEVVQKGQGRVASNLEAVSSFTQQAYATLAACGWDQILIARTEALLVAFAKDVSPAFFGAVEVLTGVGPGLTPAGDDWLAGWLLGLRLVAPRAAERAGDVVLTAAKGRTTWLSNEYLTCYAAGEADAAWQTLITLLSDVRPDPASLSMATRRVLARGATSGAAMFLGFISAFTPVHEEQPCPP